MEAAHRRRERMRTTARFTALDRIPESLRAFALRRGAEVAGLGLIAATAGLGLALASWSVQDPSFNHAAPGPVRNLLGAPGAVTADLLMQMLGLSVIAFLTPVSFWGWRLIAARRLERIKARLVLWLGGGVLSAGLAGLLPPTARWPLPTGLGGVVGDAILAAPHRMLAGHRSGMLVFAAILAGGAILCLSASISLRDYASTNFGEDEDEEDPLPDRPDAAAPEDQDAAGAPGFALVLLGAIIHAGLSLKAALARQIARRRSPPLPAWPAAGRQPEAAFERPLDLATEPLHWPPSEPGESNFDASAYAPPAARTASRGTPPGQTHDQDRDIYAPRRVIAAAAGALRPGSRALREVQPSLLNQLARHVYRLPPLHILGEPRKPAANNVSEDALSQNARLLEGVLEDFGVKGEIVHVRPGPVVTLYELEPAPGIKSSRVIGLADDIARSMAAVSARVAVVQGRNAIGIELPNQRRETVYLRELLGSQDFEKTKHRLAIALGKT
ncbi:MAG: DNA translocase FtsK 4TM domain-containing protein, partial [Methylocella sp.]